MKQFILILAFLMVGFVSKAQDECNEFYKLFLTMDSLGLVAKAHAGDTAFYKHVIMEKYKELVLFQTQSKVVATGTGVLFEFNEQALPNIQAKMEMCIERLVNFKKLYSKQGKEDASGYKMTLVYRNKKDQKTIFFLAKGTNYDTNSGKLVPNQLYLCFKTQFYQ